MPLLSIIIPTYNSQRTIGPLLDSIYGQDFKDAEVIVVDDGSSDATESIVRKFGSRFFKSERNMGPSHARNIGASNALAESLVFFDSDVVLQKDVLLKFHNWMADRNVNAVIGIYDSEPLNEGLTPLYKALQEQAWFDSVRGDEVTTFTPSVGAVKRELFLKLGGFDTNYRGAEVEDYQFSHKLLKDNVIYFDRTIKVRHNFPYFGKLVRSYFRRCYLWIQLFLKNPRFDNNSTTPQQASSTIFYTLSGMCSILVAVFKSFAFLAVIFLACGLFFDRRFIAYAYRAKGPGFMLFTVLVNLIVSWVIMFAACAGLVGAFIKKSNIGRYK